MHQLARWFRPEFIGRPASSGSRLIAAVALLTVLWSCRSLKTEKTKQQLFQQIAGQLDRGDYVLATQASKEAWLSAGDSNWGWRFKLQYALGLIYLDKVDQSADLLKQDLPLKFQALRPRFQYVKAYSRYRQHDQSSPLLVNSAIAAAQASGDAETEADGLLLLLRCGQYTKIDTVKVAGQALSVSRRNHLAFEEVASLSELGLDMVDRERYADAIPYFVQTAARATQIQAHFFEVASLINVGECYFNLGDLDRALRSLLAALPLLRAADPSVLRIEVNNELGSIYSLQQKNTEAIHYFREAFAIAKPDPGISSYVPCAENLAQALVEAHAPDEAEKYNNMAAQALKLSPVPNLGFVAGNEFNRAAIEDERGHLPAAGTSYRKVLEILRKEPSNSTQWSAYARLAEVDERLGKIPEARSNFEKALAAIESNRSQQKVADYQITFLSSLIRFYQQYVDFLVRQQQPWSALAVADSSRASVLTGRLVSSRQLPDFAAKLHKQARDSRSAILFYWLAPLASYLWAVTPTRDVFLKLPSEGEIDRDVRSYSAFIQGERQDTLATSNAVGKRLFRTLIGGVSAYLPPGSRVVVVPDGALHGLNFETLLVQEPDLHYWLQDVTITVAPSLSILLTPSKNQIVTKKALIMGDPVYKGTEYPALPESGHEVKIVSACFPTASKVLIQQQAVPGAYARSNPALFSLIHFSAHVDADAQSPLDSAIILSAGEGGSRLYARDVMAIPLNADLVTISGCRSVGAKALSGEGMVGFAWAAFQAGARNAVTSLWAVDDRSTADLMDGFYAGVTAGKPFAVALRDAKLHMLQSAYRKPYYWAPFQLYSRSIDSR